MNTIIDLSQIQESIVKIEYKNNQGSGFFVSKNIILTAYHTFFDAKIDDSKIIIYKNGEMIKGKMLSYDENFDLCLIESNKEIEKYLPLQASMVKVNEDWETFGFPYQGEQETSKFSGTVSHRETGEKYDIVLNCVQDIDSYDYSGLSGSPVITNGAVTSIILKQIDNRLGAITINKIREYLNKNKISFQIEEKYADLPNQFVNEIKRSVKNNPVLVNLEKSIIEEGNWILLTGNPGSGKSLNIASYDPEDENISIIGKYFTKIPNDDKPKSLRTSKSFFLKWLEELVAFTLYGTTFPKEDKSIEERIERLPRLIRDLSDYYSENNEIGVLFIDGLDEIEELKSFLGVINFNLAENVKIVLSCTSKEILPSDIRNYITSEQIIKVTPIKLSQCEFFIQKEIGRDLLNIENVQRLAYKSEGHPLYLRYLTSIVKNNEGFNEEQGYFEDWLENIPVINGDIENYYNSIWDEIHEDKNKLWISLSISQLRNPLEKEYIIQTLPSDIKHSFYSSFPSIEYLFTENQNKIEVYHNSFKEFIAKKVRFFIKDCNDNIVVFCEKHKDNEYSVENTLYHYALSSTPERALEYCNQEWADKLAFNHIEPDLVLLDIKNTISLSIQLEKTTELIRLLLLLQRIEFRYDYVLYEYAQNIALALIANEQYEQALKYIVRRNILLVSNNQAIVFLQLFYEAEANKEANVLLNSIAARFRKEINSKSKSGEGIPMDFFTMKANSIILSMKESPEEGFREFMAFSRFLQKLDNNENVEKGKSSSGMTFTREFCTGWHQAYVMRTSNIHIDPIEVSKFSGNPLNNRWAKMIALSKYIYDNELNQYNTNYYEESDDHLKIVRDIEYLISNHGYISDRDEIEILINSLIKESKDTSLVTSLIENYFEFESIENNLREDNGVDFDFLFYTKVAFQSKCKGYINQDNNFPEIKRRRGKDGWELYLNSLIENVHFTEGKVYSIKAKNQLNNISLIKERLHLITESIDFIFEERSHWDRSYQLPEAVFPLLYAKLIHLYYHFDKSELGSFLERIKKKPTHQLGLYSEGYRAVLCAITKELLLLNCKTDIIMPLVELWKLHILKGVQNRWERTEELLKISEIYGLLNHAADFENVFQEVLNTSMGPSWYKEAQLDLLNSTLSYLKNDNITHNTYIKNYAALLDYASGEMTFQRYVRYEKEGFLSSLILNGRLNLALEYFKQEILPPPELLISNAEQNTFDTPTIGNGYNLGARNFVEQSGVLKILKPIKNVSPYLKWALCQIFTINDDNFRYINDFGENIAKILNEIEELDNSFIGNVNEDLSDIIENNELNQEDRRSLLNQLSMSLTSSNISRLKTHLLSKGIILGSEEEEEVIEEEQVIVDEKNTAFTEFNNSISSGIDRLKLIKLGVSSFEKERINIWNNSWSTESREAKKNLKQLFSNDIEVIQNLSSDILKFYESPWSVSKEIIWFLEEKIDQLQIEEIHKIVNDHFHYIIRPDADVKEKYLWLEEQEEKPINDTQIVNFLIWLLNHPSTDIRERVFNALVDLAIYMGEDVVINLIKTSLSEIPLLSTQSSSFVLKKISEENPEVIKKVLIVEPDLVSQIINTFHFTIKYNFIAISNSLKADGYEKLQIELDNTIHNSSIKTGDIFLEENFLLPIDHVLEKLNSERLLNREFCEILISKTKEYCYPLETNELEKSDKYLKRSFYDETEYQGRYNDLLNHALNVAISSVVNKDNMETIYKILNNG